MEKILKKLKVSDKFKMVFRWIIGMFAFAIIVSVFLTITIAVSFRTFYNDAYSNTILEFEAQRDVQMIGKLVLLSVNSDNKEDTLKYIGVIDKKMQGISDNAAKLQENFDEPELTGALISELGKLKTIIDELNVPLKAEKYDEAYTIYDEKFYSQSEAVQAALNAIGTAAGEHATKELNTSSYLAVANIFFMIIVAIATIFMSIRIAKVLSGIIVAPVQKIQQALGNLHDGKLNTDIEYDGEDEFAELIADYTDTCNNMHTIIEDAGRLLGEMAEGNFNINTNCEESYVGDFRVLIESMRKLNRQLDGTLKQITEMSNQVAMGSDQLEQSSQALAEGATDQAGAVEELTATIESVTNIATESADVASMAAEQMADAAKEAEKSKAEMDELIAAMDRITATSKEIENIIGAIEDIASQTNLLSLNASIEAARAGEAGRGFAVVADQIGKLAADSAQSAVDTRELIAKSLEEVEKGNEITRNTAEAIAQVLANMSKFAQAAAGSAEGSRTQAEMLRQIEAGIEQISTVVQSNSASAEQTSAVSEELSAQAESMKDLIDRFDLRAE